MIVTSTSDAAPPAPTNDRPRPAGSYLKQVGLAFDRAAAIGTLEVLPALAVAPGMPRAAALVTLADCVIALQVLADAELGSFATAEMSFYRAAPRATSATVHGTAELVRRRRTGAVFRAPVLDGGPAGAPLGLVTATFMSLSSPQPTTPAAAEYRRAVDRGDDAMEAWAAVESAVALDEVMAPTARPGGGLELALADHLRNSWGALAGGMAALLVELAAEQAVAGRLDGVPTVEAMTLHFLAPNRTGPVVATAEVLHVDDAAATVEVTLRDLGDDRVTMEAVVRLGVA